MKKAQAKKKSVKSADTNCINDVKALARQIAKFHKQAEELGLFLNDRGLLECSKCGLIEDVAFEGHLTTYRKDDKNMADTGLRFEKLDETSFRCPVCGETCHPEPDEEF